MRNFYNCIIAPLVLFACMAMATSCRKGPEPFQNGWDNESDITVSASIAQPLTTKVSLEEGIDGSNRPVLKQKWEQGDVIVGWDESGNKLEFVINAATDINPVTGVATFVPTSASADIPGSGKVYLFYAPGKRIDDIADVDDGLSLIIDITNQGSADLPLVMSATGTVSGNSLNLVFSNETSIIIVKNPFFPGLPSATVTELNLSGANNKLSFTYSGKTATTTSTSSHTADITVSCGFSTDATGRTSDAEVYFTVLPDASATSIKIWTSAGEGEYSTTRRLSIEKGNCYSMSQLFSLSPNGALNGVFSVKNDEHNYKAISFSRGNLQYQASSGSWRFAAHQYDAIGDAAGNTTDSGRDSQEAWIDLFGWGATGLSDYVGQPYSISELYEDYNVDVFITRDSFSDWGMCMGVCWRTLLHDEWDYLLSYRETNTTGMTVSSRFAKIKVDNICGLVIFPDTFAWDTAEMGAAPSNCNNNHCEWMNASAYSVEQFEKMESAGCVFLPVTGIRQGHSVTETSSGYYWSSSSWNYNPYSLKFTDGYFFINSGDNYYGCSVRLVYDVKSLAL